MPDTSAGSSGGIGAFLSMTGSLASLAALVLVLVDKAAATSGVDPQLVVWRICLALLCLMLIGGTWMIAYNYIHSVRASTVLSQNVKVLRILAAGTIAIMATAVFADGFFAAAYWHVWLWGISRLLMRFV